MLLVPLAVESFGGWGTASVPIFKTLWPEWWPNRSDQPASSESCWLYQRLAIALQKNNACAMIARQPLVIIILGINVAPHHNFVVNTFTLNQGMYFTHI